MKVVMDSGPVGLVTNPKRSLERWLAKRGWTRFWLRAMKSLCLKLSIMKSDVN